MSKKAVNASYTPLPYSPVGYSSFSQFYPYYLGEHHHNVNRRLHLVGTSCALAAFTRAGLGALALVSSGYSNDKIEALRFGTNGWRSLLALLGGGLAQGYFFAWLGHLFFEHNRPATFKHPLWSLAGDVRMLFEVATMRRPA